MKIQILVLAAVCLVLTTASISDRYDQFKRYTEEYGKRYDSKAV